MRGIVCTIGPASRRMSVLERMAKSGMTIARLNLAHGSLDEHRRDIRTLAKVSARVGKKIRILMDLPGPKIRIGELRAQPVMLKTGREVTLTTRRVLGTGRLIPVVFERLPESVSRGGTIYINDGFIQLEVLAISGTEVRCRVIIGGAVLSRKGVNLPGAKILDDAVSDEDLALVDFGLKQGVSMFGISFVRHADDVVKVKEFARKRGKKIDAVAKIERRDALRNIEGIIKAADAVMVARGDLGVEIPIEDIAGVQKSIVYCGKLLHKPVITATQMLESMTDNIRPTRAEVTDVANAILDGADAVMLSEETAIGNYPVETVQMMRRIIASIERWRRTDRRLAC